MGEIEYIEVLREWPKVSFEAFTITQHPQHVVELLAGVGDIKRLKPKWKLQLESDLQRAEDLVRLVDEQVLFHLAEHFDFSFLLERIEFIEAIERSNLKRDDNSLLALAIDDLFEDRDHTHLALKELQGMRISVSRERYAILQQCDERARSNEIVQWGRSSRRPYAFLYDPTALHGLWWWEKRDKTESKISRWSTRGFQAVRREVQTEYQEVRPSKYFKPGPPFQTVATPSPDCPKDPQSYRGYSKNGWPRQLESHAQSCEYCQDGIAAVWCRTCPGWEILEDYRTNVRYANRTAMQKHLIDDRRGPRKCACLSRLRFLAATPNAVATEDGWTSVCWTAPPDRLRDPPKSYLPVPVFKTVDNPAVTIRIKEKHSEFFAHVASTDPILANAAIDLRVAGERVEIRGELLIKHRLGKWRSWGIKDWDILETWSHPIMFTDVYKKCLISLYVLNSDNSPVK